MDDAEIKEMVRARYGGIAAKASEASCCAPAPSACCGPETASHDKARRMGYSEAELAAVPEGANLGLRQPAGNRRDAAGRDRRRSWQRRGV